MPITTPCYCWREDVMQALDIKPPSRAMAQIDRNVETASRNVEGALNRFFYPNTTTFKFDWPSLPTAGAYPWRLWLDEHEVLSVAQLTSGGVVIPPSGYLLEPVNDPPYSHIDINLGSNSAFAAGTTWQQSILVQGVFGFDLLTAPGGALAAAISTTAATTCTVTDSSLVGVGATLLIDSERLLVTGKAMTSTSQTLQGGTLASDKAAVTVVVSDGTKYAAGETLLLDAERMLITDIAGDNLVVLRAQDGTTLATHTGSTIYALRQLTVVRGFLGTTAATHSNSAAVAVCNVPPSVRTLTVAEAINLLQSEGAGWARTIGSGDNVRNASGAGLATLRAQARTAVGRQMRTRAI